MSLARLAALAALVLSTSAVGCAANTEAASGDDDPATADAAITACGSGKYQEALKHYKAAVAKAKQRRSGEACDEATISDIASEAQKAVNTCAAFSNTIKTSPWAAPIREELQGSLILPVLRGEANLKSPSGVKAALAGVTMFGPAPGVYGNVGKIAFEPNGRGYIAILNLDDNGAAHWGRTDTRWSVEGGPNGAIKVKVVAEYENETEQTFLFDFKKGEAFYGADNYRLELQGSPNAPGAFQSFDTYPSECEA